MAEQPGKDALVEAAVAEGGAYDVIRKRLEEHGRQLEEKTQQVNAARIAEIGSTDMQTVARVRVRTEHNSVARDIVQVGDYLLFGYNVFIGLKKEVKVEDVFSLFALTESNGEYTIEAAPAEVDFLQQQRFSSDFRELYQYYKHTRLIQLTVNNGKLLAGFQIGEKLEDIRVFRWSVSPDGKQVEYIDNRGERDIQLPPAFDFEWQAAGREDFVNGRHPHINILDRLFVDTLGGTLSIKVEDNTESGQGIYSEPVEEQNQSLDDVDVQYALVGDLVLLRVLPYREQQWRHFVFNTNSEQINRIDAIGESCVQLPEDHGIIFPGGYYLQNGEYKSFDEDIVGLKFKRMLKSPNGEDVLYIFYEPADGVVALLPYNLINRSLQNPIISHGYALAEDGRLVVFTSEEEPTRVHPMQVWQTPYTSQDFADRMPVQQTFFGRIGNSAMVRGVSDLFSIARQIREQNVSVAHYEKLGKAVARAFDAYYWLDSPELDDIDATLKEVAQTSELVIDEFEKVDAIRRQSATAMAEAEQAQQAIITGIGTATWEKVADFVESLDRVRHQRGHLATISEYRYIDTNRIAELDAELVASADELGTKTVEFLADEQSLAPYLQQIAELDQQIEAANSVALLKPLIETMDAIARGLDLLSELMATLKVDDATVRTRIIDAISAVYAKLNQTRASAKHRQANLGSAEAVAQFSAQFKLFSQSINNALGLATDPDRCEEQLSRLLVQLEELESQFGEHEQFLADIIEKREEIYDTFESHKQTLIEQQQRKVQVLVDAAQRMLGSIEKRSNKFTAADDLNTYFAADALVLKIKELTQQLGQLGGNVQADDIGSRFKMIKDQALRSLRDKSDIFIEGGKVIKLGPRHRFSVNTDELDLSIVPYQEGLAVHLAGTQYFEAINHPDLLALKDYWNLSLESESDVVYRAEYLAFQFIQALRANDAGVDQADVENALQSEQQMYDLVRAFATPRYKEGYEKGIHDYDAAKLLMALLPLLNTAGLLTYLPRQRALAQVFWVAFSSATENKARVESWPQRAASAYAMRELLHSSASISLVENEVVQAITQFNEQHALVSSELDLQQAAVYLVGELQQGTAEFVTTQYATQLLDMYRLALDEHTIAEHQRSLRNLQGNYVQQWRLSEAWLEALLNKEEKEGKNLELVNVLRHYVPEAVAVLNLGEAIVRRHADIKLHLTVDNLMGAHARIQNRSILLAVDTFMQRLRQHVQIVVPAYQHYLRLKHEIANHEREALRLESFKAQPLSSFVRNKLIDQAYLPIIGDNLAKQIGTVGDSKRTDLMGLLMMISPPGYGKTTLMEYVANRLGLIFMKINCPALGHNVLSLDPEQAPNATARQELQKLNLGLEMGNNVMLYLDDIQHTNAEFLQKFISLCDATRRIEGVWRDKAKTYDMRGRRFCVVMAGNPYTESGEAFKVPDMLANRADIYNLGDILGGMDEQFALSYIENSLTSNAVLAPLAVREMGDVYKLVDMAKGLNVPTTDLSHSYSSAEINEITGVLKKLFVIQDVVLKINQQYIASAAQDDKYRVEPAFLLQGSYRNMNKMAEKVSAVMNDAELAQLIDDHYQGEAQLLTSGAEGNLLKLAELRDELSEQQAARWQQIKTDFLRNKAMGGDSDDIGGKINAQLADLVQSVQALNVNRDGAAGEAANQSNAALATSIEKLLSGLQEARPKIEVINQPVPEMAAVLSVLNETIDNTLFPILRAMDKKIDIDLRTQEKMHSISEQLRVLQSKIDPGDI